MYVQKMIHKHRTTLLAAALIFLAILLPVSATKVQSGTGYHLTPADVSKGDVSSGGTYTLAWIDTQVSSSKSSGGIYHLALIVPADNEYGICLPLTLKTH